jgi:hypothetical protein
MTFRYNGRHYSAVNMKGQALGRGML